MNGAAFSATGVTALLAGANQAISDVTESGQSSIGLLLVVVGFALVLAVGLYIIFSPWKAGKRFISAGRF